MIESQNPKYNEYYSKLRLDEFQKKFIESKLDGPIALIANSAAGKSFSIVNYLFKLWQVDGISPYHMILTTFSNRAAEELRNKFKDILEELGMDFQSSLTPLIGTIHSVAYRILGLANIKINEIETEYKQQKFWKNWLKDQGYEITNSELSDMLDYFNNILVSGLYFKIGSFIIENGQLYFKSADEVKTNYPNLWKIQNYFNKTNILNVVEKKDDLIPDPIHMMSKQFDINETNLTKLIQDYFENKIKNNCFSFNDFLLLSISILGTNYLGVCESLQFQYGGENGAILIDEAQDQNVLLYTILRQIAGKQNHVIQVGDTKQTLYRFMEALPQILENATMLNKKGYPVLDGKDVIEYKGETKRLTLQNNYRSPVKLVKLSNNLAKHFEAHQEPSFPKCDDKTSVLVYKEFEMASDEYKYVSGEIKRLIHSGVEPKDIMVISRNNAQLNQLEAYLIFDNIPYNIRYNKIPLYQQQSLRLIIAIIKIALNPKQVLKSDFITVLENIRGVGEKSVEKLEATIADEASITEHLITVKMQSEKLYNFLEENNFERILQFKPNFQDLNDTINEISTLLSIVTKTDPDAIEENIYKFKTLLEIIDEEYKFSHSNQEKSEYLSDRLEILFQQDKKDIKDAVLLSSVHGIKGLQAKYVFWYATNPIYKFRKENFYDDLCLTYVAVTRAQDKLYITNSYLMKDAQRKLVETVKNPFVETYISGISLI